MTNIAVVNAGSSSLKFAVFSAEPKPILRLKGVVEGMGAAPRAILSDAQGAPLAEETYSPEGFGHVAATEAMMRMVAPRLGERDIAAIGHRVVHGGGEFVAPLRLTEAIVKRLEAFVPLAPLHQPHNLAIIRAVSAARPGLAQFACFDTAFHHSQPQTAQAFAIPREYSAAGIRRYGFHGVSYTYVAARLRELFPDIAKGRVIAAHLGNGASLCAMTNGSSLATTMGFTAVDGLMMGTRCGALDPGVLIHMMDRYGMGPRELEDLIYRQSGLLGVSGVSSDMRRLRNSPEPAAKEAIALFVYRIIREIGSLAAALGGVDGLVFTGGIGENDACTRAEIAAGCAWLGLTLDEGANGRGEIEISAKGSKMRALVVPTNEELEIARSVADILLNESARFPA